MLVDIFRIQPPDSSYRPTPEQVATVHQTGLPFPLTVSATEQGPFDYALERDQDWFQACMMARLLTVAVSVQPALTPASFKRSDPITRAHAIAAILLTEKTMTLGQLAGRLGTSIAHLSHYRRLLTLPSDVRDLVTSRKLPYGKARLLVTLRNRDAQSELAHILARKKLSTRNVEKLVRVIRDKGLSVKEGLQAYLEQPSGQGTSKAGLTTASAVALKKDPAVLALERHLADVLGSPVEIRQQSPASGELVIAFHNLDILDGIVEQLTAPRQRRRDFED